MNLKKQNLKAHVRATGIEMSYPSNRFLEQLSKLEGPALLESSALHENFGRYSIIACCPLEVLTLSQGLLQNQAGQIVASSPKQFWQVLAEAFEVVQLKHPATESTENAERKNKNDSRSSLSSTYLPGWIGYIGYEVARMVEHLPEKAKQDTALPDMRLAFYDAILIYDAIERSAKLVELIFDDPPTGAGKAAAALVELVNSSAGQDLHEPIPTEQADANICAEAQAVSNRGLPVSAIPNFDPHSYRQAVAKCIDYIAAGDIFQVNLSQRFKVASQYQPMTLYRALRKRNPAWYSGFLEFTAGDHRCAILSSSPELFLAVDDGCVLTRPIKGTRPRVGNEAADATARNELWNSPKDNAELAMIIDLLRNDLGRVCQFGSVIVKEARQLETHPTVFHLVGSVEGRLREGIGLAELLQATFPGGSITGAPKIRAMEIIDEIEPCARGVYTGCIGIACVGGKSQWNIAIRTIVCDRDSTYFQVGGGIVADSQPQLEYDETLHKARAMIEAIQQTQNLKFQI